MLARLLARPLLQAREMWVLPVLRVLHGERGAGMHVNTVRGHLGAGRGALLAQVKALPAW